jgi:asparagine synthase (glutamine-hydrolysing)
MMEAQIHRGPSGGGLHRAGQVVLGHRRLAIIDLSDDANQPMSNEDGSIWLTYNGEIYNHCELRTELRAAGHRFKSRSDTEVIVHGYEQWGIERLLDRLRGMFAFGLYDPRAGLLLARDRLGIKPLYYYTYADSGLLLFASEVKALLHSGVVPNDRDREALAGFLLAGSVPAPRTIVRDVQCLLPGHYLHWRDGRSFVRQYWDLRVAPSIDSGCVSASTSVRSLLEDSISRHLMSDVPLGVFLSGGVDSGAVVTMATRARSADVPPLTTLTITFDEPEFSESEATGAVAARFHTDHREIRATGRNFVEELPKIFAAMDQPTNDGVNTYFISKAARQAGLTVVLSGLGGDEVFWGYKHYRWLANGETWLARCPASARRALAWSAERWGKARGRDNWMRAAFVARSASSRDLYLFMRGFFAPQHVRRLLGMTQRELQDAVEQHLFDVNVASATRATATGVNYIEVKRYLHDQLLRDSDVFSMAHSIELRVPLLDHPLVEYAARVPPALKVPNGVNKPLLVGAVNDRLVSAAGSAPKRGFSLPMDRWLKRFGAELGDIAASGDLLEKDAVHGLWSDFEAGRLHWSRAWALTVLGATVH